MWDLPVYITKIFDNQVVICYSNFDSYKDGVKHTVCYGWVFVLKMCIILIVKGLNSQETLKWTGQDLSNSVWKTESCTVCSSTNKKHQTNAIVWEWGETKHKEPSKLSMRIILGMNGDLLVSVLYWPGKICDLPKKKIHPDKSSCDSFTWSFTVSCLILNLFLVGCCHLWEVNVKLKF